MGFQKNDKVPRRATGQFPLLNLELHYKISTRAGCACYIHIYARQCRSHTYGQIVSILKPYSAVIIIIKGLQIRRPGEQQYTNGTTQREVGETREYTSRHTAHRSGWGLPLIRPLYSAAGRPGQHTGAPDGGK